MSTEHDNHGSTPANWTGATIVMIAFTVGTIGVVIAQPLVFGLGVLLLIAGMVAWKVMAGMAAPDAEPDVG
jgi:hypothetical protein